MTIEKRYPCVADLEAAAMKHIPGFMRDFLIYGIGNDVSVLPLFHWKLDDLASSAQDQTQ